MATISSGSITITIQPGEQYRFIATGEAYLDIGGGSTESYRLAGATSEKLLGGFIVATPFTIRVVSGSVEYNLASSPKSENVSRTLRQSDNGETLTCADSGINFTIPSGLNNFGCAVIKNGTTQIIGGAGVTVNGTLAGTVTITADVGAIVPTSVANSYRVVGV